MKFSQDCVDLVFASEGCKLTAYDDARPNYILKPGDEIYGTLTIGRGHTGADVHIGLVWTQSQADNQCLADIEREFEAMQALVTVPLTQGQTDALTDFVFEEGSGRLKKSTLLTLLNQGNYSAIPNQLCRQDEDGTWHGWVYAEGKAQPGLIRRRQAEIALWNKPDISTSEQEAA